MYIHGRDLYILQNVSFSLDDEILEINISNFEEWEKSRSKNVPRSRYFSHISGILQLPYRGGSYQTAILHDLYISLYSGITGRMTRPSCHVKLCVV